MRPDVKHGKVWRKGLRIFAKRNRPPRVRFNPVFYPLPPREEIIFFPDRHPL